MSETADNIRAEVARIIEAAGVQFSRLYVGQRKREEWDCDAWLCTFTKNGTQTDFDHFTGLGHRKPDESAMAKMSARALSKVSKRMLAWEDHYKRYPDKPQAPHPADVLYSLILDSSAVGQSFESWCSEYGYDTDSRKAHATYEACQQGADKLARIFNAEQREALQNALQDY